MSRVAAVVSRLALLSLLTMLLIGCGSNDRMELIYAERCLGCHGTAGKGDGPIAASLPVPTPDFRATVQQKNVFQIRNVIKEGKGVMPAFAPALRNPEIQDMVRIVRILSQQGRDLEWWEKFEPLVWAHCGVPWEYVYGYDQPAEGEQSP